MVIMTADEDADDEDVTHKNGNLQEEMTKWMHNWLTIRHVSQLGGGWERQWRIQDCAKRVCFRQTSKRVGWDTPSPKKFGIYH